MASYYSNGDDFDSSDTSLSSDTEYIPKSPESTDKYRVASRKIVVQKPHHKVWSEDDEIVILEGLADFSKSNQKTDYAGFYPLIKDSFSTNVSRSQLTDKICRLRKKFRRNEAIGNPHFSNAHGRKIFDLSNKIWGSSEEDTKVEKKRKIDTDSRRMSAEKSDDDDIFHSAFVEYCLGKGLNLRWLEKPKKARLERLWKEFCVAECHYRKVDCEYLWKLIDFDYFIYEVIGNCYEKSVIRTRYC